MQKLLLFLASFLFLVLQLNAQVYRYQEEIFEEVQITSDVVYGVNMDIMPMVTQMAEGPIPMELLLDVYEPVGDTFETERPLVLVFHDGHFLPNVINGEITGTKTDSSSVEICTQLAKRGFVAASVDYRLGWNPVASQSTDLTIGLVQAIYRSVQDGRTAIRFFKKNAAQDGNTFQIDSNKITAWGNGSGGVISLNMVALSHINEIVNTTHAPGKLIYDSTGDGIPNIPIIIEIIHGDIEGKNTTILDEDYLFFSAGDTTNLANHPNYNSDFNLSINVSGFVIDIGWMSDNTIPTISFQSPLDMFYPYDDAVLVQSSGTPVLQVQGAEMIGAAQNNVGNDQLWIDNSDWIYNFSAPYTDQAIANSLITGHPYYQSVYPSINPPNTNGYHEGIVIDWWDPEGLSPEGIPWNELAHPSGLGSYHDYSLLLNENMSPEKARLRIDTLINYFVPRACFALGLDCPVIIDPSSNSEVTADFATSIYPNPTTDFVEINAKEEIIQEVQIYDTKGVLVKTYPNINQKQTTLQLGHLSKGLYILKIKVVKGIISGRITLIGG